MAAHPDHLDVDIPGLDAQYIGGTWRRGNGAYVDVVSPTTEEVIARVADPTIADADAAVAAARQAFDLGPWPALSALERIAACTRLCDALERRLDAMNRAWAFESGATIAHGEMINSGAGVSIWRSALANASKILYEEDRGDVLIVREPIGTVLGIMTYNGPIVLMGMKIIPALLAGCTVIVKHAPESPLTSRLIAEAVREAALPDGVVSVLAAGTAVTQHLVGHAGIDMVALTGGTAIGVDVVKRTADRLARTALELGGKSPAIITDDVNMDEVMATLGVGSTGFMGQVCVNLSRVLAPRSRYDEVVDAMATHYRALRLGDPFDPANDRGPLAVERARDRVEMHVRIAREEGARVVCGGRRPAHLNRGWFYEPTLVADAHNGMRVAQEEIFGPVTAVIPYDTLEDAVAIANDSPFGLACSVYAKDLDRAHAIARRIRAGSVAINQAGVSLTEPFGGYKQSGWGKECGIEGIGEFLQIKQIVKGSSHLSRVSQ
ncbi:MAG: aldehyde dehydrogenase family protein [Pseudomonadales bacterium]|jgi:acyl-CoA reductase-like NAD-dependent aldehyde dehydrogenase